VNGGIVRIAFLMQGPEGPHVLWDEVGRRLADAGADVEFTYPDVALNDLAGVRVEHDLYVLKSGSALGLSMAGALHAAGAAILNPYPVAAMCRDKIVTSAVLAAAGVPIPETWVTEDRERLRGLLDGGPIVVKPFRGSRGLGVKVVYEPAELGAYELEPGPLFVQRYHPPDGLDYKLYCIGEQIRGVRRVWPARTFEEKLGEPFEPDDELCRIARGCAAAIGADILGFDVVYSAGRPFVVDLSGFPGFKGVPDGPRVLADEIESAARRVVRGEPVIAGAAR
jgi:glutathione synthase/RimK-type ligase-like ATP-grasp enzyme